MAESSSAMRIVPAGMSGSFAAFRGLGQKNSEDGAARHGIAFDDTAMVADDLGNQSKAQAGTAALGRDERIEDVGHEIWRHAGAIVAHRDFKRQAQPLARNGGAETHAGAIAGG